MLLDRVRQAIRVRHYSRTSFCAESPRVRTIYPKTKTWLRQPIASSLISIVVSSLNEIP
jgi:hypothetical protein